MASKSISREFTTPTNFTPIFVEKPDKKSQEKRPIFFLEKAITCLHDSLNTAQQEKLTTLKKRISTEDTLSKDETISIAKSILNISIAELWESTFFIIYDSPITLSKSKKYAQDIDKINSLSNLNRCAKSIIDLMITYKNIFTLESKKIRRAIIDASESPEESEFEDDTIMFIPNSLEEDADKLSILIKALGLLV